MCQSGSLVDDDDNASFLVEDNSRTDYLDGLNNLGRSLQLVESRPNVAKP